jgi:hypothetical protein
VRRKTGSFTESELERGRWWWRRLVFAHFDPLEFRTAKPLLDAEDCKRLRLAEFPHMARGLVVTLFQAFQQWETRDEIGALRYELVRRLNVEREFVDLVQGFYCGNAPAGVREQLLPKAEFDSILRHLMPGGHFPSWPYLVSPARSFLGRLREDLSKSCCGRTTAPMGKGPGWSEPAPPDQWDLNCSDTELTRTFLGWINEQRQKQGIPNSFLFPARSNSGRRKSQNKGNRHRKVSWRWPEVMDIHRLGARSLTDSERSIKSAAKAEALKWKPVFLEGLSWLAFKPGFTLDSWQPKHDPVRWMQENFDRWYPAKARESLQK